MTQEKKTQPQGGRQKSTEKKPPEKKPLPVGDGDRHGRNNLNGFLNSRLGK